MDDHTPGPEELGIDTLLQHLGEEHHFAGAVVQPIFQNSLFVFERCADIERVLKGEGDSFVYTRMSNPTTALAEKKIAALEGTEACRLFSSGMGAISAAILSTVRAGSHVVCTNAAYGPTKNFLTAYLPKFDVETTLVDGTKVAEVQAAVRENTALLYLETPGSITFDIQDLEALVSLARERGITTICDNSAATPIFQKPASFGVDLVVHSVTKYLAGHSDVVAGCVCGSQERIRALTWAEGQYLGASIDPFAAWLLTRSLRTLPIRMRRHQQSATEVAEFLQRHPAIEKVNYPGLANHSARALIEKQMTGASGMLSFQLKNSSKETAFALCESLRLFQIGVSWGGHESLAIPVPLLDGETWVIRLSVGLETASDLIADLRRALEAVGE
jgi:cystathionine beta-lyase/cystathionine gamma-synthase